MVGREAMPARELGEYWRVDLLPHVPPQGLELWSPTGLRFML